MIGFLRIQNVRAMLPLVQKFAESRNFHWTVLIYRCDGKLEGNHLWIRSSFSAQGRRRVWKILGKGKGSNIIGLVYGQNLGGGDNQSPLCPSSSNGPSAIVLRLSFPLMTSSLVQISDRFVLSSCIKLLGSTISKHIDLKSSFSIGKSSLFGFSSFQTWPPSGCTFKLKLNRIFRHYFSVKIPFFRTHSIICTVDYFFYLFIFFLKVIYVPDNLKKCVSYCLLLLMYCSSNFSYCSDFLMHFSIKMYYTI